MWIDTHCHLDAAEFDHDRDAVVARARRAGVGCLVLPAVDAAGFEPLRALAHAQRLPYALGIHPLRVGDAGDDALDRLADALRRHAADPLLVAVGEIGLDHYVAGHDRERQSHWYRAQLALARDAGLPVLLHVRGAVDAVLQGLRRCPVPGGIAHAFNGSPEQAVQARALGLRLGFGGALTHPRALRIRELVRRVADDAPVLETDAPDIAPHWLVQPGDAALGRAAVRGRNEPAELPRIGAAFGALRGWSAEDTAAATAANACAALPRMAAWLRGAASPARRDAAAASPAPAGSGPSAAFPAPAGSGPSTAPAAAVGRGAAAGA